MNEEHRFEQMITMLGLHEADVHRGVIRTGDTDGPTYLSSNSNSLSAVKVFKFIRRIDDLKAIIGNGNGSCKIGSPLKPWPVEKDAVDLDELCVCEEKQVYRALLAYLLEDQDVESYMNIIKKRYFPMRAGVFAAEELIIDEDHPLIIEGHDPVILNFKIVRLKPGGQIITEAPVIMSVDQFIKM